MFFLDKESLDKALVSQQEAESVVQSNEWDVEICWETNEPIRDKNGCYILKRK